MGFTSDKSMYFIGYIDAVDTDYFPKEGKNLLKYLRKVCIFQCCCNANLSSNEFDKPRHHWLIVWPIRVP